MSDDGNFSYGEIFPPGELGDRKMTVHLTAREAAAIGLALYQFSASPLLWAAYQGLGGPDDSAAEGFRLALWELNATVGRELARAVGHDDGGLFTAKLAEVDQAKAAWRDEGEAA